ncbi:transmembrane protein 176 isoform X2 [Cynoglossus semilaevis]|uniref:Transmembrane protein 176 n=1 Tax=Cynoglossus semilaevis TaxID=244447 RepID=A0A3P8WGC1_CYNSE|nr:uncharacterized protein LOC103384301 isoform X2 [Cynoglossus semilaevis]
MAVAVSRDLTVQVVEDVNAAKLTDRQQALRASIQKGEPKCLGVSQVMMGIMVMSYSIPLHVTEFTEVVTLGVPWWSGLMFVTAGVLTIILDKYCSVKILQLCLTVSLLSIVTSLMAVSIYAVDVTRNPVIPCVITHRYNGDTHDTSSCEDQHFTMKLSNGIKSTLLLFSLVQSVISAIVCFLLYRNRQNFQMYSSLTAATSDTLIGPNLH